jgi:hypothetical protein
MGYIARKIDTNIVYYSKGANKLADKIDIHYSTITKFFNNPINKGKDKLIKGYIVSKTIDLANESRGKNIKFLL